MAVVLYVLYILQYFVILYILQCTLSNICIKACLSFEHQFYQIYDALGKSECSNFPWLQLMFESADALEYLHSLVFLHNDIKTDNMLLTGDSSPLGNENVHVVLCDFGKATEVSNGRHYKLTSLQKQEYYKKHSHIAPEVIEGHHAQSIMSDIFSFGLVFYHVAKMFENQRLRELAKLCTRCDPCLRCCLTDLKCKIKA